MEKLDQGAHHKLVLISAPAGFGKTTLVTEWLNHLSLSTEKKENFNYKIAWLSLDERDNDPVRFLSYFIGALNQIDGESIGKEAIDILQSSPKPPMEDIITILINDIAIVQEEILIILDDLHLIENLSIHESISGFLDHLPPHVHLVIATREDPLLPLSRLRVREQLTEVRASDLRFSVSEAVEFLNRVMGLNLSIEDITALEQRTEGWIAGLQLAAISLQGREGSTNLINSFTGSNRLVLDYLIEEVLHRQSEEVQNFLLQTSVLDKLTGSLCNALAGQGNGQEMLEMLDRVNLFIVRLDEERRWYRYHHLFAELLLKQLRRTNLELIPKLHIRASEWYEKKNMPPDAIRHAIAADDFYRAAELAELVWPAMHGSVESITWLGWLKAIPNEIVQARPLLGIGYAWANLNAGNLESADKRLLDVERWLELAPNNANQQGASSMSMVVLDEEQLFSLTLSLSVARAYHAQAVGDVSGTVKHTRKVLDLLPEGDTQWRGDVTALLGLAYWASGNLEEAHQTFSDGLAGMKPLDVIVGTFVLAEIKMALGYLHEAIRTCEHALQLANEHGEPMPMGTEDVYSGLSELHREQGDLEAAALDLATCKKLGEKIELPDWQYRYCLAQSRLKESLGDLNGSLELLHEAEQRYVRTPLPVVRPIPAMKARVWTKMGRLADAHRWADERGLTLEDEFSYLNEFEHITLARIMIALYIDNEDDSAISKASKLLERLLQEAEEGKRIRSVIEILILQALSEGARGNITAALEPLNRALALAEPEGYLQIFIDEGPPMARLLFESFSQGIFPDYVQRLLAVFPLVETGSDTPSLDQLSDNEWLEQLSNREIEVLQLIADGLTNQDIATRLFLSLHTVKGHARNIYSKLGVKNRTQAVAKGKSLGILE
jgi:LuxR family maltose regulon positive regulatory protein